MQLLFSHQYCVNDCINSVRYTGKAVLILFQFENCLFFQNKILLPCYLYLIFSPADKHLDVKKTSFKKLSKFLKEMEKAGYIKVKELSKGVESITEMKKDHPE